MHHGDLIAFIFIDFRETGHLLARGPIDRQTNQRIDTTAVMHEDASKKP